MKNKIPTFDEFINESHLTEMRGFTKKEVERKAKDLLHKLGVKTVNKDLVEKTVKFISNLIKSEKLGMVFEHKNYKRPTSKVSGKYEIEINGKTEKTDIAGFERHGDDTDSLYFMNSDKLKNEFGSIIIQNKDIHKLERGAKISGKTSKGNLDVKLKRIGDL